MDEQSLAVSPYGAPLDDPVRQVVLFSVFRISFWVYLLSIAGDFKNPLRWKKNSKMSS